jgi:hypothetical protein
MFHTVGHSVSNISRAISYFLFRSHRMESDYTTLLLPSESV